jgi:uncharacterized membrane protein
MLLIWCIGFSSPSLFPNSQLIKIFHPVIKNLYGTVCHQQNDKTFIFSGQKFLVCARCTGIYFGALLMSFLSLFFFTKLQLKSKALYFASAPILFDVICSTFEIYKYSKDVAFITGMFFGSIVFLYIASILENNFHFLFNTSKT